VQRVGSELRQQLELLGRERDHRAGDRHAADPAIDHELTDLDPVAERRRRAPQNGADPRDELVVDERPRQVVVAASGERADAVDRVGLELPEHDDGHVAVPGAPRLALAETATQLQAAGVRLVHAYEHQVRARSLEQLERLTRRRGAEDLEPVFGEVTLEEVPRPVLGLRQQECSRHGAEASSGSAARTDVLSRNSAPVVRQKRLQPA
jgi:hypothetical protein